MPVHKSLAGAVRPSTAVVAVCPGPAAVKGGGRQRPRGLRYSVRAGSVVGIKNCSTVLR